MQSIPVPGETNGSGGAGGVYFYGTATDTCLIEGNSLVGARTNGQGSAAGICFEGVVGSSVTLKNTIVRNNTADTADVGGVYLPSSVTVSEPVINCRIVGNKTGTGAVGGLYSKGDNRTFRNCEISGNIASGTPHEADTALDVNAGGASVTGNNCVIEDSRMDGNYFAGTSSAGATAIDAVGGLRFKGENIVLRRTIVKGNILEKGFAGGVNLVWNNKNITLENCLIADNCVRDGVVGGVIASAANGTTTKIHGCTIVGNHADTDASRKAHGLRIPGGSSVEFVNSIVTGNGTDDATRFTSENFLIDGTVTFKNCCLPSSDDTEVTSAISDTGKKNMTGDPRFRDEAKGDYRLTWASACRNAGDNTFVTWAYDLAGKPRIQFDVVDIGAYECQAAPGFMLIVR